MITIDHVVAFALRDRGILDQLGEALRSDLVLANPFYRRLAIFADDFYLKHHKLPASGDWELWLDSLHKGMEQDGTKEALGYLQALDLSAFTPGFFGPEALKQIQTAAVQVARARLNDIPNLPLDAFTTLADELNKIKLGSIQGLVRLRDTDTWVRQHREDDLFPTGYPMLDQLIGGWGKELWMIFADSGVGKSMWLQNAAANAAMAGKKVLHITLELGLRPQILRYYRQIAQVTKAQFNEDLVGTKGKLDKWFRYAQGEILLLEFPAFSLDPDQLKRIVERLLRSEGQIDLVTLDYLDLMVLPTKARAGNAYNDLGRITHETRSLCPGFDLTVLTASQAVRRPVNASRLTQQDMGDSYQKVRGADGLLSLVQTPEEEEMHQGRLGVLKVRDSGGRGTEIGVYINRELALIQELAHPNTKALMQALGHNPLPGLKAIL